MKKKHPNLPNGYGSIKHLSGNRSNPYAVYPPATQRNEDGIYITPPALCYVRDWYTGFAVLTAYKAGTYTKGMEKSLYGDSGASESIDNLSRRILSDYSFIKNDRGGITFSELYARFYQWKFGGKKRYAKSTQCGSQFSFKHCAKLHNRIYAEISYQEMQDLIDSLELGYSSISQIVTFLKQLARYAMAENIVEDMRNVELLKANAENDIEHGVPFTDDELRTLWANKENDIVRVLLIMCYSGYRIGELNIITVDLDKQCFFGGIKTESGKARTVPIHSAILPLVEEQIGRGEMLPYPINSFRIKMYATLERLGIPRHTPHGCRHTFSRLCEKYGVSENDRKRLMGHSFGNDITNKVYGHRTIEELREEIEKIQICC